ncbi:unnamed protein product, partial [Ceratitis capitata]
MIYAPSSVASERSLLSSGSGSGCGSASGGSISVIRKDRLCDGNTRVRRSGSRDYYTREVQELLAWCERVNKGQLEST